MDLKTQISAQLENITTENISVISMKLYYLISDKLLEINTNKKFSHSKNKIYTVSSLCADNIECMLKNILEQNINLDIDKLTSIIYKFIITNIKYI